MPTLIEYAQLSARVYKRTDENRVPIPQGWNELLWLPDNSSGFSSGVCNRGQTTFIQSNSPWRWSFSAAFSTGRPATPRVTRLPSALAICD